MSGEYLCACVCYVAWKINDTFKIIELKVFVTLGSGELSQLGTTHKNKVSARRKEN